MGKRSFPNVSGMSKRSASLKRVVFSAALVSVLSLVFFASPSHPSEAQQKSFQLTVRNLTERQPISPPIVVVHGGGAVLLPSSAGRLEGLEAFAESGSQPELMESLRGRSGVKARQKKLNSKPKQARH